MKWSKKIAILSVFVLAFVLTGITVQANYDLCGVNNGSTSTCKNTFSVDDGIMNTVNIMSDTFKATDAYHIYFSTHKWQPTVTSGNPIYKEFWIIDNYNGGTYIHWDDSYNGYPLNEYSSITTSSNVTAEYHPSEEPATTLRIQNMAPQQCAINGFNCRVYNQASWFKVN